MKRIAYLGVLFYYIFVQAFAGTQEEIMLQQNINNLQERVEGLTTLVEGYNDTISQLQNSQNSERITQQLEAIESRLTILEQGFEQLNKEKRDTVVNIETQKQSNALIATSNEISQVNSITSDIQSTNNADLYREAVILFQKKQYENAKKIFADMVADNYKAAASNYYLGEIAYYTKAYSDAIYYYKKSVKLYDKATYMDTLMLHTAIALENIGDYEQARLFFETIVHDYPENKSAQIANEHLKKK